MYGTIFLMWLENNYSERYGNGISLIIFAGIVGNTRALVTTFELGRTGAVSTIMILAIFFY